MADIHHLSPHDTKVRCRNCTHTTGAQTRCYQVCRQCDNIGLCSESCFKQYHMAKGFTMIAAAIKKPDTQPDRSRDPSLHFCEDKPPTANKARPRGKCTFCRTEGRTKDTYKQCHFCKKPYCNDEELQEHHRRNQMLDLPQASSSSGQQESETQTTETRSTQTTQSADQQYSEQGLPANAFYDYYYTPKTYAPVPYLQWPLPPSSTPLQTPYEYNIPFQSTIEGNTSSLTPINPDPVDDSLVLTTSPIGHGPKTPPELNQTEVPLDYSSQGKRPRRSETPESPNEMARAEDPLDDSNQPKRPRRSESPESPNEMDRPEVPLDESRHLLLGWLESQSNLRVTRSSTIKKPSSDKAPAKPTKKKIKIAAKKNAKGEYADLFSDDEENTKEPKKKKKPAASTSSGQPGLGVTSIGPTLYPSSDSDIDPVT